jgi:endonuclease III
VNRQLTKKRIEEVDRALARHYRTPEAELGNVAVPLDEAIYILLSFQTDVARVKATWLQLRSRFPTWEHLAHADQRSLARVLRPAGLQAQKARLIKRLLREVRRRSGGYGLDHLHQLPDGAAEAELLSLPGMSWKAARCVLLYALDRAVFPVDVNTFRVFKRLGLLPADASYRSKVVQVDLQGHVPPRIRRRLHVNLVIHGQRTCLPRRPNCGACPVRGACKMGKSPVPGGSRSPRTATT